MTPNSKIPYFNRQKMNELQRLKAAEQLFLEHFSVEIAPQLEAIFERTVTYEEFLFLANKANEIINLFQPFRR